MTTRKPIRITHPQGLNTRTQVFMDGEDIGGNITEVEIILRAGRLPEVKLTVIDVSLELTTTDYQLVQWESEGGHVED